MWPKILAQLVEFLPHATRLMPLADRFLQQRSNGDEATQRTLEGIRADLAVSAEAHNTVRRQLSEQAAQVLAAADAARQAADDARASRSAMDEIEGRTQRLERRFRTQSTLLALTLGSNVLLLILVILLLVRR